MLGINANSAVAFTATPQEIKKAFELGFCCPRKTELVTETADYFEKVQGQMPTDTEFSYKLGQENEIPENLKGINVDGVSLEQKDTELNDKALELQCSKGVCGKEAGNSNGEIIPKVLKMLGVPNPNTIDLLA